MPSHAVILQLLTQQQAGIPGTAHIFIAPTGSGMLTMSALATADMEITADTATVTITLAPESP